MITERYEILLKYDSGQLVFKWLISIMSIGLI
jgi:sRNA-binding regulator protein Hfq